MTDDATPIDEDGADDLSPDEAPDQGRGPGGPPPLRSLIGAAAVVLVINGVLLFTLASLPLVDPSSTRCALARDYVEDANDDDETFNDVDLGGREVDDLECDEAIATAEGIPTEEDGDGTVSINSATAIRVQSAIAALLGLLQVVGGLFVLRQGRRWARNLAVVAASAGVLFPIIGLPSLLVIGFVVYALVFSGQSKAIWPRTR